MINVLADNFVRKAFHLNATRQAGQKHKMLFGVINTCTDFSCLVDLSLTGRANKLTHGYALKVGSTVKAGSTIKALSRSALPWLLREILSLVARGMTGLYPARDTDWQHKTTQTWRRRGARVAIQWWETSGPIPIHGSERERFIPKVVWL